MQARGVVIAIVVGAAVAASATEARAQDREPAGCYGFAFGRWHPALDLATAGHAPQGTSGPTAPAGRSWAALDSSGPPTRDAGQLMLMPPWWPAGVRLSARRLPGVGDTVSAIAIAPVADGRAVAPRSQALVWGKRCDEPVVTAADSARGVVAPVERADDTPRAARRAPTIRPRP